MSGSLESRRAHQLMRRLDTDGDGRLQREEVPAKSRHLFKAFDRDGDETVCAEELGAGLARQSG